MFNIRDFGAIGDSLTLDTWAIQQAIDACASSGGGTVVIPKGTFLTGTLYLKSHVELHLDFGACILGSPDLKDYNKQDAYPGNWPCPGEGWNSCHLLIAYKVEDIAITGQGTIDGNGKAFFAERGENNFRYDLAWRDGAINSKDMVNFRPGQMIAIIESKDIVVQDVSLHDSTCWTLYLHACRNIRIHNLKIDNPTWHLNTDGIDLDCCQNAAVSNCIIDTGDDAIAIRGVEHRCEQRGVICENITISNCVFRASSAGSRIGVGNGEIRNVTFSNIVISRCGTGFQIQSSYGSSKMKGVTIHGLRFENIICRDCTEPISIVPGTEFAEAQIEDITFAHCSFTGFYSVSICGNAVQPVRDIRLYDVDFTVINPDVDLRRTPRPESYFNVFAAERVRFDNVRLNWKTDMPCWKHALAQKDTVDFQVVDCMLPEP